MRGGGESRRRPATACSGAGASAGASRGWSPRGSRGGHQDRPATAANDGDEMHYEKRPNWYGSYSTKGLSSMAAVSPRIIDRQAVLSRMEAERLATEQRAKRRPARKGRGASKMKAAGRAMPRQRTIRERRVTGGGGGGGGGDSSATGSATTTGWAEEDDHNTQARGNSNLGTSTPEDQTGVWGPDNWVPTVPPEGEYPVLVTWWDRREAVARMSAKAAEAARARKRMQKAERRKRAAEGEAAERAAESREFAERRAALARHARAVEAFEEYDEDGSGAISFAEFCCVLCTAVGRELGIFELRLLFNQIDQDRSGEINYGEFIEWWSTIDDLEDLLKFTERQAYSYNDTNDDMVLSFLEFKDLLRIFLGMRIGKNKLRRLFISLDLNGDGCVNRREFYAWFERERAAQAAARKAKIAKVAAAKAAAAAAAAAGSPGQDARSPGAPPDFGDEHSSSSSSSMASRKGRKAGRPVPNYGGLAGDSSAVRPPPRRRSSIDMRAAAAAIQVAALRKARAAGPAPPKLDRPWTAFHTRCVGNINVCACLVRGQGGDSSVVFLETIHLTKLLVDALLPSRHFCTINRRSPAREAASQTSVRCLTTYLRCDSSSKKLWCMKEKTYCGKEHETALPYTCKYYLLPQHGWHSIPRTKSSIKNRRSSTRTLRLVDYYGIPSGSIDRRIQQRPLVILLVACFSSPSLPLLQPLSLPSSLLLAHDCVN